MRNPLAPGLVSIALCVAAQHAEAEYIDYGQPSEAELRAWLNSLRPLSDAGWVVVAPWNGSDVAYVSKRDALRDGSVVSVRVRWEFMRDTAINSIPYRSSTERIDFDCLNKQFRFYDLTIYTGNNLTGDHRSVTFTGRPWNPYVRGPRFGDVGNAVCLRT
jgi:hypothetical protein